MPRWFVATVLGGLVAAACVSPEPYVCAIDADCTRDGVPGRCLDDGTCSGASGALSGDECFVGTALAAADSTCTATVCTAAPWCCAASWGPACVQAAEVACEISCSRRVAFARERLTNPDHTQLLEPGSVDVWDFSASDPMRPTGVATGIEGLFAYDTLVWADVDRDRAPELLVTTFDSYVGGDHHWLFRPAAGPWQEVIDLMALGAPNNLSDAAFGDYDRDGRLDLVGAGGSAIATFHGVPTSELFTPGRAVPALPEQDPLTASIDTGDVDGDGDDDLVYLDYRADLGRVVRSDPEAFVVGPSFATASVVTNARFGDVDGDRDLDLLVSDGAGAQVLRNDSGLFTVIWSYPSPRAAGAWSTAIWVDVDGDRDPDVALGADGGGDLVVLENLGGGALGSAPLWQVPTTGASDVKALAAGDLDGDGDLDLVVAAGDDDASRVWLNDGDRTFSLGWTDSGPRRHRGVAMTSAP